MIIIEEKQNLLVGLKSSLRALKDDKVKILYVAEDAEQHVTRKLLDIAQQKNTRIEKVDSMKTLGQVCNIDVGAAAAVIIK